MPCGLKPCSKLDMCFLKDRSCGNRCLVPTSGANQSTPRLSPGCGVHMTCCACKPIWPPQFLQIGETGFIVRKPFHKLPVWSWLIYTRHQYLRNCSFFTMMHHHYILCQEELSVHPVLKICEVVLDRDRRNVPAERNYVTCIEYVIWLLSTQVIF